MLAPESHCVAGLCLHQQRKIISLERDSETSAGINQACGSPILDYANLYEKVTSPEEQNRLLWYFSKILNAGLLAFGLPIYLGWFCCHDMNMYGWKKQQQKKTVGIKPWNSSPSQLCTSNISGDLWSHLPFTVKALTGDFACLCDSTAPVSRLCDWNLVWDQLNRRDRHVFLSPRGGNHWKELTRAEISEQSSATGNLSAMGVRGKKKAKKKEDFTGGASRMGNGCRRT